MLLIIDLGLFSFFCKDQSLDEDLIPFSSDEEGSDGGPSSSNCEVKKGKEPDNVTGVKNNSPETGN